MKFFLIPLSILMLTTSFAQNWIDLANVYWRISPSNDIEHVPNEKRDMNMYVADAKLPIVIGEKDVFILGLEYQYTTISSRTTSILPDYSFSSSMLQLGWEHKWNQKSKMLFMAIPRFNSDYNAIQLHHFQLGGLALGTTKRSENFDWKYGMYYNGELFGPMFVPLFGFNWKINEHWRFKMIIPLNFELSYRPKNWIRIGIRFDGINASYAYQTLPGLSGDQYIDKADNNAWAFSEFHLGKNIWFHLKAGHSVLRKYRYFNEGDKMNVKLGPVNIGDERNANDPKAVPVLFENGWSFEARFIYRLPL